MMVKVVNPCVCNTYQGNANAYAKIKYEYGELSICGVVGPQRNGNCKGSAGQCIDEIRSGEPTEEWTHEMLQKFCDIWDRWHLNHMNPCCEHQRELGWMKNVGDEVKIEKWTLTNEASKAKKAAEKKAIDFLKAGKSFYPTKEEVAYANMPYEVKVYNGEGIPYHDTIYLDAYELKEKDCLGRSNIEYKKRGWISYSEHPLGLLGRPCPVCGYKYGHSWKKEEVPEKIIKWLFDLPATKTQPAWI